ncbi:MAG: ATPase, T2SS/T4P/T4SS family [Halofilum sp. (in: g-proteobacteria)]|nr:ATPase, T2SS/T4P/T4SS family [Halofilum sp. (in: g-proteobacteria)]
MLAAGRRSRRRCARSCRRPRAPQFDAEDGTDFAYTGRGLGRFRVNVFRQFAGLGAVFRWIPDQIQSLESLGLPEVLQQFALQNNGLVLVTGKTGSGKSTTLAAMLDAINQRRRSHIITIEDPVEFVHTRKRSLVSQREVGRHTPHFAAALRSALREDPDVVMVGELRDLETVSLAVTAAEMGILIFGTLHTAGAVSTIDRLVNTFPPKQPGAGAAHDFDVAAGRGLAAAPAPRRWQRARAGRRGADQQPRRGQHHPRGQDGPARQRDPQRRVAGHGEHGCLDPAPARCRRRHRQREAYAAALDKSRFEKASD